MNTTIKKPAPPIKPQPPNKTQTHYRHNIDVDKVFFKTTYWKYSEDKSEEVEIPASEYDGRHSWYTIKDLAPSLKDLLSLVPEGISIEDVHLSIEAEPSEGFDVFEGVSMYYETPFDYESEKKKYDIALAEYEKQLKHYQTVSLPAYKAEVEKQKEDLEAQKLAKRKIELESELAEIQKKL